jgi:hypothetical protein
MEKENTLFHQFFSSLLVTKVIHWRPQLRRRSHRTPYMQVQKPPYFADVLKDARAQTEVWHWIVQKHGSHEILAMGQEATLDAARQGAEECMTELLNRDMTSKRTAG